MRDWQYITGCYCSLCCNNCICMHTRYTLYYEHTSNMLVLRLFSKHFQVGQIPDSLWYVTEHLWVHIRKIRDSLWYVTEHLWVYTRRIPDSLWYVTEHLWVYTHRIRDSLYYVGTCKVATLFLTILSSSITQCSCVT